jgi:hypothetical protein
MFALGGSYSVWEEGFIVWVIVLFIGSCVDEGVADDDCEGGGFMK